MFNLQCLFSSLPSRKLNQIPCAARNGSEQGACLEGSASCASAGKEVFIGKKFQWKRNFNARCVGWMEQLLGRAWGQGWLLLSAAGPVPPRCPEASREGRSAFIFKSQGSKRKTGPLLVREADILIKHPWSSGRDWTASGSSPWLAVCLQLSPKFGSMRAALFLTLPSGN